MPPTETDIYNSMIRQKTGSQTLTFSHKMALALLIFTVGVATLYLMRPISDPDFFWHLKTGQWILQNKALPVVDPFSLAPPPADDLRASFILSSYWLSQVIYASLYSVWGWCGIALVRVGLVGAMAALFASRCDLRQPANVCLLLLGAVQMLEVYPVERPQMFSFGCFMVLLVLLDRYSDQVENNGKPVLIAVLVSVLMLVWSNLHGGYLVGQVTLMLFLVMEGVKFLHPALSPLALRRYGGLVMIVFAGLAASSINPNSFNNARSLLGIGEFNMFQDANNIEYYSSLRILREYRDYTVLVNWLMIALVTLRTVASLHRLNITWLVLLAGTAYMGCLHVRYMPFFLVASLLFLGKSHCSGTINTLFKTILIVTALVVVFWFTRGETRYFKPFFRGEWGVDREFPVKAADFVAQHDLKGPVFNPYLWGGYLLWRLGPEKKVFCDGRQLVAARTWEWMTSNAIAGTGEPYWKGLFRKHGIQTAIVPITDPSGQINPLMVSLRMDKELVMVFAKDNSAVFVRR